MLKTPMDQTDCCPGCKSPEIRHPSFEKRWLWYNVRRDEDEPRPVNYCPMCGWELPGQEEEKSSDNPNMP